MSGTSKSVKISVAGSGELQLQKVVADSVTIDIAGSATALVHANSSLKVSIAGSGDVSYSGKAKVEQSIAGSGSVKQIPEPETVWQSSTTEPPVSSTDSADSPDVAAEGSGDDAKAPGP